MFGKVMTVFGPRVVAGAASFIAGWIYVHTKGMVTVDATQVVQIGSTMLGSYAVTHRVLSAIGLNPGDSASGRLAAAEKEAVSTGTAVVPTPPVQH
jgi:hypothetical protein